MSRYHYNIWNNETDNLSSGTLCRLLEEDQMNMKEGEVWSMVMDWAGKELKGQGLQDNPQTRRKLLEQTGVLHKIRFLTLLESDLCSLEGVLSKEELAMVKKRQLPEGFCNSKFSRKPVVPLVWRSPRLLLYNRSQVWLNRGEVEAGISSSSRVLIIGFEFFTRLARISDYAKTPGLDCSYKERLIIFIKDSDGTVLQKTDYDGDVPFNSSQSVHLVRPFWFESNVKYTVSIGFIGGQYPICTFTDNSSSKGIKFFFEEVVYDEDNQFTSSFIMSVLYAL